jgi:hypothetical protein
VSLITMTPQDGGVPMTTLTRRTKHLAEASLDRWLAGAGSRKA